MIIPTGTIPISPGTKRAFGSLLLTVLLLAVFALAGNLLYVLYLLVAWTLTDVPADIWGPLILGLTTFGSVWWGIWHTMRQDGLFEDDND